MTPDLTAYVVRFFADAHPAADDVTVRPLRGDGSQRKFWRVAPRGSDRGLIAMWNPPSTRAAALENIAYLEIGTHLWKKGMPLPEIHRHDPEHGWFIMEDLGDTTLQDHAAAAADPVPVYERVVETLFRLQFEGARGFDTSWCCQTASYDRSVMIHRESEYFRDAFLGTYLGMEPPGRELAPCFEHLADAASHGGEPIFLHRDFQSRNIMVHGDVFGIIDWQGGRLGPAGYDLASLLIDPYTGLTRAQQEAVHRVYTRLLEDHDPGRADPFRTAYPYLAVQRNLQILGAFSYLTRVMHKPFFETYIPPALDSLRELLGDLNDPGLSPLESVLAGIAL